MTRKDVTAEAVARAWLDGMSILTIANGYGVSRSLIETRLAVARATLPDLPWDAPRPAAVTDSAAGYVNLRDGKPELSAVRAGSVIRSRGLRRRNG